MACFAAGQGPNWSDALYEILHDQNVRVMTCVQNARCGLGHNEPALRQYWDICAYLGFQELGFGNLWMCENGRYVYRCGMHALRIVAEGKTSGNGKH